MRRPDRGAIPPAVLHAAERAHAKGRELAGSSIVDAVARLATGATMQLAWKEGEVIDLSVPMLVWPTHQGDPVVRGIRKALCLPRFWPHGHMYSAKTHDLLKLRDAMRIRHGEENVGLAVAYRVDEVTHIGTLRRGQAFRAAQTAANEDLVQFIGRKGAGPASFAIGVSVDGGRREKLFAPVATEMSEQILIADYLHGYEARPVV